MIFALIEDGLVMREVAADTNASACFVCSQGKQHPWSDILSDETYQLALNLLAVEVVPPTFDPITEMVGAPDYAVGETTVVKTFEVVPRSLDDNMRRQAMGAVSTWRAARKRDPILHNGAWVDVGQLLTSDLTTELLLASACKLRSADYSGVLPAFGSDSDIVFPTADNLLDLLVACQTRRASIDASAATAQQAIDTATDAVDISAALDDFRQAYPEPDLGAISQGIV